MEFDVAQDRRKEWINELEGLNGTVKVHVKDGVLIVPHSGIRACYLVTDEEETIVTRIGLNLTDCGARSCPGLDSRLHSDGRTDCRKIEKCRAAGDRELTIGEIVEHVALRGMRLAPRVFMRGNVGGFAKITCPWISAWD